MEWQASLLDAGERPAFAELPGALERVPLGDDAWLDVHPAWMTGTGALVDELLDRVPWRAEERPMYDRIVAVPRLTKHYRSGEELPFPALVEARRRLSDHYRPELGEELTSTGLCLYRDGRDSVAWHGDTIGRGATHDTIVAIVSLGSARVLALRRRGGGPAVVRRPVGHGDLLVMGGSCQRTWEHAVPKTARAVGPRISVQFRPAGVR